MPLPHYNELLTFIAVARARSFTRAAAQLGVSQSALSHAIRTLEARMGVRLLTRTTRSVAPTEAGERLLLNVAPRFEEIEAELAALAERREQPAGRLRITAPEYATETILWPCLAGLLPRYPEIRVELIVEPRFTDIVAERYDMGVRLGDELAKDMRAVRIGPDLRIMIVAAPAYLAQHPAPHTPQDLAAHACINMRLMSRGELQVWELQKAGQKVNVHVEGQLIFNRTRQVLQAALAGFGLGYVPAAMAQPHLAAGRLYQVLADWSPQFPGYHLYYPSQRQPTRAMAVLIEALSAPFAH